MLRIKLTTVSYQNPVFYIDFWGDSNYLSRWNRVNASSLKTKPWSPILTDSDRYREKHRVAVEWEARLKIFITLGDRRQKYQLHE